MDHISLRQMLDEAFEYAGKKWYGNLESLINSVEEADARDYVAAMEPHFAALARQWNDELNTEWTCRMYLAAKMTLAVHLMQTSAEYSLAKNVRVAVPYLQYYSILYSLKAIVLTLPYQDWRGGTLMEQTHTKTINVACDEMSKLFPEWRPTAKPPVRSRILEIKAYRELISYRAPSSGDLNRDYTVDSARFSAEAVCLAQLISEVFEQTLVRNVDQGYCPKLLINATDGVFNVRIGEFQFFDRNDYQRIEYLCRKRPFPANLEHIITEGHMEDFFGSWSDPDGRDDVYEP